MLEQGRHLAAAQSLSNMTFLNADATALPWAGQAFDLVACRLTLHQVGDPAAVVREMVRVTRPGGRIGITDMIASQDPAVAAETERLERLRARGPRHHTGPHRRRTGGRRPHRPAPPPRPRRRDHVHPRLGHRHRHPRRLSCGSL
jgi:SAM-dependent methyltransferase